MIRDVEIRGRARRLGVDIELIRKDYVLNHVLAAVAELGNDIVFRGGTALARVYWPDFRISEDLDFLVEGRLAQATEVVEQTARAAAERTGVDLAVELTRPDSDMVRALVGWGEVQLAVALNRAEGPALPVERRELDLPYSDLSTEPRQIRVVALEEILANKWFMLDDRKEPRDLFDLWSGICVREVPSTRLRRASEPRIGRGRASGGSNGRGNWRLRGRSGSLTRSTTFRRSGTCLVRSTRGFKRGKRPAETRLGSAQPRAVHAGPKAPDARPPPALGCRG